MTSYHNRFKREWLFEAPMSTGPSAHNPYDDLVSAVNNNIEAGNTPVTLANSLKKLVIGNQVTYWLEHDNTVDIITQFEQKANGLFVELTGKRPGANIYASDFYQMVLNDAKQLIFSGDVLSDQGFGIWNKLFASGRKLFVYNTSNTDQSQTINSVADLENYLSNSPEFTKYRFVLSESAKQHSYVQTSFDLLKTYNLTFNLKGLT
jgi:hypothetical protein